MSNSSKATGQRPDGVEYRVNVDGSQNPKYVDLLDEDKPVAGQKFVCVSFLSPEKILKDRNMFNFSEFLKQWDMSKSFEKYTQFLSYIAYKHDMDFDTLTKDLQDFCNEEKSNLFSTNLEDEYKNFLDANEKRLDDSFNQHSNFQTSVRGLKVRGSYPSQQEAELRCKMLREVDANHDVFVGPVGMWMPYHPEAYKTGRVEYLEDELNQLMHEKKNNESKAKVEFDKRVREAKEKAIEDNKKKALESGNVLTQTINEQGDLVSVKNRNPLGAGDALEGEVTAADVRKELFDSDNVVIDYKNSDHGVSQLVENGHDLDASVVELDISETDGEKVVSEDTVVKEATKDETATEEISTEVPVPENTDDHEGAVADEGDDKPKSD